MGNDVSNSGQKKNINKASPFSVKKLFTKKKNKDNFIFKYNQSHPSGIDDITALLDERRVVFISLNGLFSTWDKTPSHILYSSIFILPLKRKWIYSPEKRQNEIKANFVGQYGAFYEDFERTDKFIQLIQWKDSQGLVFWMLDKYASMPLGTGSNMLVNPFWYHASNTLINLYDPVTKHKYQPLQFDENWWRNVYNKNIINKSETNVKVSSILSELYLITRKYKSIKEILYQSNPNSFNIIYSYKKDITKANLMINIVESNSYYSCHSTNKLIDHDKKDNYNDQNDNDEWVISLDYYNSSYNSSFISNSASPSDLP